MISNLRRWLVRGFYKLSSVANEGAVVRAGSCWWGKVNWTVRKVLQWWCITTTTVYQCTTTSGEPAMHHFVINDSAKEKEIAILSEVATILSTLQGTDISTISKWNNLWFVFSSDVNQFNAALRCWWPSQPIGTTMTEHFNKQRR